jgi:hypothetical protein
MGRTISLETNDVRILHHAAGLFAVYEEEGRRRRQGVDFVWKIVTHPGSQTGTTWPKRSAHSESGLRYAEFGQTSFLAVDLDAREGVGYLTDVLAGDDLGLTSPFLDNMLSWTAGSLGLTPIFAACVGVQGRALLVAGAQNSGKTTASYLAAKKGLDFHSDRAVFLEMNEGALLAWGDFAPATFRPEALKFLPELRSTTRPFRYSDLTFHCLNKHVYQTIPGRPVIPVCCVFLDRQAAGNLTLSRLSRDEIAKHLGGLEAFRDDSRFEPQRETVFNAIKALPAYELKFAGDPAAAAECFPNLLRKHSAI